MKNVFVSTRASLNRRHFLSGAGVSMALPMLGAMTPAFAKDPSGKPPCRMVAIQTNQGIMPQFFFPEKAGKDYETTPYLKFLSDHREHMTLFSGVSLPGVDGGHAADKCFLTGTPHPGRGGFRNGISLDQFAAESVGNETRFASLSLSVGENRTMSFTRSGAPIPPEGSPRKLYEQLFLQGKPDQIEAKVAEIRKGRSLLDFVSEQSKRLSRDLAKADQDRVDQYYTSVRELERRMKAAEDWEYRPKPKVEESAPNDIQDSMAFVDKSRLMFDTMKLALETDSTRIISFFIDTVVIHNLTHHGGRQQQIAELRQHEEGQFQVFNQFLSSLREADENGKNLLDSTMVLYGTCMGSANSHSNYNLPVLLAGGGFQHGKHLKFDTKHNYPLSNLHVSMLQRLGIETDTFSTGKGTMRGLEMA
jgi:hypothetical protein